MAAYLGVDTSNYTTSVALYDGESLVQRKRLLPVKEGELGLRQSDAVFEHTRQLPELFEACFSQFGPVRLNAVGASARPRNVQGSYMPCFLAGISAARAVAASMAAPFHEFSHQAGHIAAAIYSAKRLDLAQKRFICFHFSGGTTDCLLVSPDPQNGFHVQCIASSLDLKAGQAIDRVGRMLGLRFPAGTELSALAMQSEEKFRALPAFKGNDVSLSGVENKCAALLKEGRSAADVARCCLSYVCAAADRMTENALREYGEIPVVYAGGVMCSQYIREQLGPKYGGMFAEPAFSSDNAAGIAVLTMLREEMK